MPFSRTTLPLLIAAIGFVGWGGCPGEPAQDESYRGEPPAAAAPAQPSPLVEARASLERRD